MSKKALVDLIKEFGGNIRTFITEKGVFTVGTKTSSGKTITEIFDKNFNPLLTRESVIKNTGVKSIKNRVKTVTDWSLPALNGGFAMWSDDVKRVLDANGNLSKVVTDHSFGSTISSLESFEHIVQKGGVTKTMARSIDGYLPQEFVSTPHMAYYRASTGKYRI